MRKNRQSDMVQRRNWLLLACLVLVFSPVLIRLWITLEANMHGVDAIQKLDRQEDTIKWCLGQRSQELKGYVNLVVCALSMIPRQPDLVLELIDRHLSFFPQRQVLLQVPLAKAFGALGDYSQSCAILVRVGAKPVLVEMADTAYAQSDWTSLSAYLDCLTDQTNQPGISPNHVADLYFKQAVHFEKQSELEKAKEAYNKAIAWYPTLWPDPLLRLTSILVAQGKAEQGVSLLSNALQVSEDPGTVWILARQLGLTYQDLKRMPEAYCAFDRARIAAEQVLDVQMRNLMVQGTRDQIAAVIPWLTVIPDCSLR